jgi:hypothetical protein
VHELVAALRNVVQRETRELVDKRRLSRSPSSARRYSIGDNTLEVSWTILGQTTPFGHKKGLRKVRRPFGYPLYSSTI